MALRNKPRGHLFSVFLIGICGAPTAATLNDPANDSTLLGIMERIYRMEYAEAENECRSNLAGNPDAQRYFSGLAGINAFSDLGDTAALRRAEESWSQILADEPAKKSGNPAASLYRGLAGLQLSYVASVRGQSLRTGRLAWSARGDLRRAAEFAEAAAASALFEYYRQKLLEKISFLPFVNPNPGLSLKKLREAAEQSHYLRDVLRASAFWIHFDRGELDSALAIADGFLARYPENRLARQMRGDALFRSENLFGARAVYESLLQEYSALKGACPNCLAVGFACSTGNLARIYAGLGLKPLAVEFQRKWEIMEAGDLGPWLPGSLKRDLSKLSKK